MSMYSIAEVTRRSGFPASTLRYYEEVGLLPSVERTASGYRAYDDDAVDRLAFIARAKQLGCSLEEISSLAGIWNQRECGPIQEQLRKLVDSKIVDAENRIAELVAFTAQLRDCATTLSEHTPNGPCDDKCGCTTTAITHTTPIKLTSRNSSTDTIAIACSLNNDDVAKRQDEWSQVLGFAKARTELQGGMRISFASETPIAELARLITAEQSCCSFFRFSLMVDERGIGLDIQAPTDAIEVIYALFGQMS